MSQPHVESQPLRRVVIDHAESELGRRLVATLADDPGAEVVAADRVIEEYASGPDPSTGAIDVILLAPGHGPEIDGSTLGGVDVASVRLLVRRLEAVGARANSVVVVASAMVYGAEPDNPLPLTEDAPRRPAPDSPFAEAKVALENEAVRSGQVLGGAPVAGLRPCPVVAPPQAAVNWLSRSLRHRPTARRGNWSSREDRFCCRDRCGTVRRRGSEASTRPGSTCTSTTWFGRSTMLGGTAWTARSTLRHRTGSRRRANSNSRGAPRRSASRIRWPTGSPRSAGGSS